jgi:hypothetical protein
MVSFFELHTGWIWLLHEESGEPYLAASQHLPPALAENPRRMEGNCYCLDTFRAGDMSGAANVSIITCTRLHGLVDGTEGLRYHASIPLYAQEKRLGVLNVVSGDWDELGLKTCACSTPWATCWVWLSSASACTVAPPRSASWRSATGWRAKSTIPWRRGWRR